MGETFSSLTYQFSPSAVTAIPSPDYIRFGDIYEKDKKGVPHRFTGSDVEYVEKFVEDLIKHPKHGTSLLRPVITKLEHDAYKRKPSLAIMNLYAGDNKLQKLNIDTNKEHVNYNFSGSNDISTSNYNNEKGENCSESLLNLYLEPTKYNIRELERCIGNTYCSNEYNALKEHIKENGLNSDLNEELENYTTCAMKRPEFIHIQKVVDKVYKN